MSEESPKQEAQVCNECCNECCEAGEIGTEETKSEEPKTEVAKSRRIGGVNRNLNQRNPNLQHPKTASVKTRKKSRLPTAWTCRVLLEQARERLLPSARPGPWWNRRWRVSKHALHIFEQIESPHITDHVGMKSQCISAL